MKYLLIPILFVASTASAKTVTCSDAAGRGPWKKFELTIPNLDSYGYFPEASEGKTAKVTVAGNFAGNAQIGNAGKSGAEKWVKGEPRWKLKVESQSYNKIVGRSEIGYDYGSFTMNIGFDDTKEVTVLVDYGTDTASMRSFYTCK